jgi:hypothetical protein
MQRKIKAVSNLANIQSFGENLKTRPLGSDSLDFLSPHSCMSLRRLLNAIIPSMSKCLPPTKQFFRSLIPICLYSVCSMPSFLLCASVCHQLSISSAASFPHVFMQVAPRFFPHFLIDWKKWV